ncbi:MAG TPA: YceI family protein [Chitinophagaceae bacterium]|nr:YceI family protein [Chitinophagaceae bacterium]
MSTTKWALDPTHSELQFKVKHLMISTVTGQFNKFNATVDTEDHDFSNAKIDFTAEVDSISTNNVQRDEHLKNTDFFDAPNHPQITFKSENLEKVSDDEYKLAGTLAMKGTSKPVQLNVEFGGVTVDPWGNTRAGFTVSGKINRQDFGVSFSAITDTGSIVLGDEVKIIASVQFIKQAVAEPALAV